MAKDPDSKPDDEKSGTMISTAKRFEIMMAWFEEAGLTIEDVETGFWIKGTGANVNEAMADAVRDTLYPSAELEFVSDKNIVSCLLDGQVIHSYMTDESQFGWFTGFFGWADTQLKNGDWVSTLSYP